MGDLDPEKNIYLQSDMDVLKKFETRIDEEIKGSPVEFFLAAGKVFNTRMEEAAAIYNQFLATPFDFTIDEEVILDGDKLNPPGYRRGKERTLEEKIKIHDA